MALKVKIENVKTKGKVKVFIFQFLLLLILFALLVIGILLLGGHPISREYLYDYFLFAPLAFILPFIVALTVVRAHHTSLMRISPSNNVNIDKIQEHLFKHGYKKIEEKPGFIKLEKSKFLSRLLWLNIDTPTIEVTQDEVLLTVDKHTEVTFTPILTYSKKFELNPS